MSGPISSLQRQQQRGWSQCSPLQHPGSSSNRTRTSDQEQLSSAACVQQQASDRAMSAVGLDARQQWPCSSAAQVLETLAAASSVVVWIPEHPIQGFNQQTAGQHVSTGFWSATHLFLSWVVGMLTRVVPSVWTEPCQPSAQHSHWGRQQSSSSSSGGYMGHRCTPLLNLAAAAARVRHAAAAVCSCRPTQHPSRASAAVAGLPHPSLPQSPVAPRNIHQQSV